MRGNMSWIYLMIAIVLEVIGTISMKLSNGFSDIKFTVLTFASYMVCYVFMAWALKTIEVGVAYAIWGAVGIVIISAIGIIFLGEQMNAVKLISTALIIVGVIGLKLSSN